MAAPSLTARVFDAPDRPLQIDTTPEGTRVTMRLAVERAARHMAGHYPGFPILPGVLLVDCVRQAAGHALDAELRLRRIDRARFARPLLPGDELTLTLLMTARSDRQTEVRARGTRADGKLAADLSVTLEPALAEVRPPPAGRSPHPVGGTAPAARKDVNGGPAGRGPLLDHSQVRARLRQRPPMLLLDTVREFTPPDSLIATKAITGGEDCYQDMADGSGTDAFAYPPALLLESFGQAVSLLWSLAELGPADEIPLMVGIRGLAYAAPALPGDVLEHRVELRHRSGGVGEFTGETRAAGTSILTVGSILVVSRPAATLLPTTPAPHPPKDGR